MRPPCWTILPCARATSKGRETSSRRCWASARLRARLRFPAYWLYDGAEPIVHLIPDRGGAVDRSGETIDHVFGIDDYEGLRRRLDNLAIVFSTTELPELKKRRLLIRTPAGVLLELVYRAAVTAANERTSDHAH